MNSPISAELPAPEVFSEPLELVERPLVSVLMSTYNHAEYLAEAIEGVMAQRASFDYELIIGEDASTDSTRQIALEYQRRYPEKIVVVTAAGNVGPYANIRRIFAQSRGRYIAFCEGDDFWCTADKLERQIACFERDPAVGGVHSNWTRMKRQNGTWIAAWHDSVHRRVPAKLLEGDVFSTFYFPKILRTCTVVYRRDALTAYYRSPLGTNRYRFGDAAMAAFISGHWRIAYLPEVTAVYRLSPGSALRSGREGRLRHLQSSLQFDNDAKKFFENTHAYPTGFRLEICVGMLLWAMTVPDRQAMQQAVAELRRHFGVAGFLKDAWKSVAMRLPTWRRQR